MWDKCSMKQGEKWRACVIFITELVILRLLIRMIMKKSPEVSIPSSKMYDEEDPYDMNSTIESNPKSEVRRIEEIVLNLFSFAKTQIANIYSLVYTEIAHLKHLAKNVENKNQEFLDAVIDVKMYCQNAMGQLPDRLRQVLIPPEIFSQFSRCGLGSIRGKSTNRLRSPRSVSQKKLNIFRESVDRSTSIMSKDKSTVRTMKMENVKYLENLDFLQGSWPELQEICLQNKNISQFHSLMRVQAPQLKILNFCENRIISLDSFKGIYFPQLTYLNLSFNKLKSLAGLQETNLPNLRHLNMKNNFFSSIDVLEECSFPQLKQLDLGGNRLKTISPLKNVEFLKLEILNTDKNELISLEVLTECNFPQMKVLSFANNSIMSLKFMENVKMRNLQALIGNNNQIKHVQPLVHAKIPQIADIILNDNKIVDIQELLQANFNKLKELDLQNNQMKAQELGCFLREKKEKKELKKKFPFIML